MVFSCWLSEHISGHFSQNEINLCSHVWGGQQQLQRSSADQWKNNKGKSSLYLSQINRAKYIKSTKQAPPACPEQEDLTTPHILYFILLLKTAPGPYLSRPSSANNSVWTSKARHSSWRLDLPALTLSSHLISKMALEWVWKLPKLAILFSRCVIIQIYWDEINGKRTTVNY